MDIKQNSDYECACAPLECHYALNQLNSCKAMLIYSNCKDRGTISLKELYKVMHILRINGYYKAADALIASLEKPTV